MKKRILSIVSATLIALVVVAFGCAAPKASPTPAPASPAPTKPATTPTPTATPAPTPAPTSAEPSIVLKAQTFYGPTHAMTIIHKWWAGELEKRTNGKVKVNLEVGDPYGKHPQAFDMVVGGVIDYAHIMPGYTPGRMPLMEFSGTFPFDWKSAAEVGYVHYNLQKMGYFDKDLATGPFKALFGIYGVPYNLFTRVPVHVPADLKGMKVRGGGGVMDRFIEKEGGTAVAIASSDTYPALQKGVVEGLLYPTGSAYTGKMYEVIKYATLINMSSFYTPTDMLVSTWNKLPPDVQKVITDMSEEATNYATKVYDALTKEALEKFPSLGVEVYTPTAAEMALWTAPVKPMLDEELGKLKDKGYDTDKFMTDFDRLRAEFRAKNK